VYQEILLEVFFDAVFIFRVQMALYPNYSPEVNIKHKSILVVRMN